MSKLIIPILFFVLSTTLAKSINGDFPCKMQGNHQSRGICKLLDECPSVYQEITAGNSVDDRLCGYSGTKPKVCCPKTAPQLTASSFSSVTQPRADDGRGAIARKKCAEYSYSLTKSSNMGVKGQSVNRSQCAIKFKKLIIGGTHAEPKEFPHMAAVGYNLNDSRIGWYCGGTLISETFVLTAAHCTYNSEWGNATWVRVGDLNLVREDDKASPEDRRIIERIRHPQYKRPSQYHDIALLRLETRVPFNDWIRPACLHTAASTGTSKTAVATGWGRIDFQNETLPDRLRKVTLPVVNQKMCNKSYSTPSLTEGRLPNGIVNDLMICAGEYGRDTCTGDSGGPLVISKKGYKCMYDVVGIAILGQFCGSFVPGVYTRVYNYISWIESIVWS